MLQRNEGLEVQGKIINGIVNINKPEGFSSSDVVIKIRNFITKQTGFRQKVGHLGTLDPLATGVLPVAIGSATKLFDSYLTKTKTYIAEIFFGATTDTLDREGKKIFAETPFLMPETKIITDALESFLGTITQIPPIYSAIKVQGKRAYKLARDGKTVEMPKRIVEIFDIKLLDVDKDTIKFETTCSSGTYIRSLVRDIAEKLGTIGYMSSLVRTKAGEFILENSVTLDEFFENPADNISYI